MQLMLNKIMLIFHVSCMAFTSLGGGHSPIIMFWSLYSLLEVPGLTLSESSIRCFNFPLTHETIALNHRLHLENTCKKSLICEASMDAAHFSVHFFKKYFYS